MKHTDIIDYLDDAIEMEVNILKFEKASEALKEEAEDREDEREAEIIRAKAAQESDLSSYQKELEANTKNARDQYQKTEKSIEWLKRELLGYEFDAWRCVGFALLGLLVFFLSYMLSPLLAKLIPMIQNFEIVDAVCVGAVMALLFWIILYIVRHICKKNLEKRIEKEGSELAELERVLQNESGQNDIKLKRFIEDQGKPSDRSNIVALRKQAQFLLKQAEQTDMVLEKLYVQRMEFYSVNIVPPDYRYLDCVGVLHQIFVNDLADTMRDAVLLYEERVFRGDLIRGIDKINEQLEEINHNLVQMNIMMRFVCQKIAEISEQAGMMVAELGNIADKIDENTAVNEMILGGIALQNAQAEAIKNNTKALSKLAK